jgi:hypothetical protein
LVTTKNPGVGFAPKGGFYPIISIKIIVPQSHVVNILRVREGGIVPKQSTRSLRRGRLQA